MAPPRYATAQRESFEKRIHAMKRKTRNWMPIVTDLVSLLTALAALAAAILSR